MPEGAVVAIQASEAGSTPRATLVRGCLEPDPQAPTSHTRFTLSDRADGSRYRFSNPVDSVDRAAIPAVEPPDCGRRPK